MTQLTHQPCEKCGSSDAKAYYTDGEKCFSCGFARSYKSKCRKIVASTDGIEKTLPTDLNCSYGSLPQEAIKVLDKALISKELFAKYGLGYSKQWNRLILPAYGRNGELLGWQGRALVQQDVKYLQAKDHKPVLFFSNNFFAKPDKHAIIVEDILSAMRIGELYPAVSILGSDLKRDGSQLEAIVKHYNHIVIWLDGDNAGRSGALKIQKRLELQCDCLTVLHTKKDPKCLTDEEIESTILGGIYG